MLFISLRVGSDYYAISTANVVEILPLVNFKQIPNASAGIAGLFDYHGTFVPAIDLTLLATGSSSRSSMITRIALLTYCSDDNCSRLLGLVAEEMTDSFHAAEDDFVVSGVDSPHTAYLGPVLNRGGRIIQRIRVAQLLPPDVRESLFQSVEALDR